MFILQLVIIQGFTFLALIFFLKKVLYNQFTRSIKRLQALNQASERKHAALQEELEKTRQELQARQKANEEQMHKSREEAEVKAEETRKRMVTAAQEEADKVLKDAQFRRQEIQRELEAGLSDRATQLAGSAMRYVFTSQLQEVIHHQLVQDLLMELEKIDAKRFKGNTHKADVVLPYKMEDKEKQKLATILEKKGQKKVQITCSIDKALIGGMVLTFETLILDGSLKGKLREAVGYVRKAEKRAA